MSMQLYSTHPNPASRPGMSTSNRAMPNSGATEASQYKHQPLHPDKRQIRLVHLGAGREDGSIHCNFETFDFEHAPAYVALSYVWGPPAPKFDIYVENSSLSVRANLYQFLQCYQKQDGQAEYLWTDQMCINQSDVAGRSSQVQFMSEIYGRCESVITWLGDGVTSKSNRECYKAAVKYESHNNTDDGQLDALNTILQHECFSRLWIVQEIVLARKVTVLVRDLCIPWTDFDRTVFPPAPLRGLRLSNCKDYFQLIWLFMHSQSKSSQHDNLDITALSQFSRLACQDPRDKVYGLMSLVSLLSDRLTVDYSKTVYEVFLDVVMLQFTAEASIAEARSVNRMGVGPLQNLFMNMGGAERHRKSIFWLLQAIWKRERLHTFAGLPAPLTGIGFESSSDGMHRERWWYDFQESRYYVDCDSDEWTLEYNRPLLVGWHEYLFVESGASNPGSRVPQHLSEAR